MTINRYRNLDNKYRTLGATSLTVFSLLLVLFNVTAYAVTDSISDEVFKNENGNRYWEVEIKCTDQNDLRFIRRQSDSEDWCLSSSSQDCFADIETAAQNACSCQTSQQSTSPDAAPELEDEGYIDDDSDREIDITALNDEKAELKAELLQIQQKKVELKRQEIELQKAAQ